MPINVKEHIASMFYCSYIASKNHHIRRKVANKKRLEKHGTRNALRGTSGWLERPLSRALIPQQRPFANNRCFFAWARRICGYGAFSAARAGGGEQNPWSRVPAPARTATNSPIAAKSLQRCNDFPVMVAGRKDFPAMVTGRKDFPAVVAARKDSPVMVDGR